MTAHNAKPTYTERIVVRALRWLLDVYGPKPTNRGDTT